MKRKFLRGIVGFALSICLIVCSNVNIVAFAASDVEAGAYGFNVDSGTYKTSVWYNTVTTNCKIDGKIIGVCTTSIGMTRAKKKVSGNYYLDQVFVKCTMKGKNPVKKYAGYSEHLTIKSALPKNTSLVAYSPESIANMKSYDIGVSVGSDKSVGISGSTTVTKKALDVNNYCDTSSRLVKICYDYKNNWLVPSGYNTYGKYAYNESIQRTHYTIKTAKSKYGLSLHVIPKFEVMDGVGYWTFSKEKYVTVDNTITFTSAF